MVIPDASDRAQAGIQKYLYTNRPEEFHRMAGSRGFRPHGSRPRDDRQLVIPAQAGIQKILNTARSMILTEPRATTGHSIPGKIARNTRQIKRRQFLDDWIPRSSRGMTQGASPRRRDENIIAAILYFSKESALF
jgi:hypothetical protein